MTPSNSVRIAPSCERGSEITERQRAALSSLLAISEKRRPNTGYRPQVSAIGFGGQADGGSCTIGGGSTDSTDSTYILDPLSDSALPSTDSAGDSVVEVVTATIVDWAPVDGYTLPGDSGGSGDFGFPSDSGTGGDTGGDGGGGDSWGPS